MWFIFIENKWPLKFESLMERHVRYGVTESMTLSRVEWKSKSHKGWFLIDGVWLWWLQCHWFLVLNISSWSLFLCAFPHTDPLDLIYVHHTHDLPINEDTHWSPPWKKVLLDRWSTSFYLFIIIISVIHYLAPNWWNRVKLIMFIVLL